MSLPLDYARPPTDNLYKLMAIGGIALIVLSLYMAVQEDAETKRLHTEASIEAAALAREWQFVSNLPKPLPGTSGSMDWQVVDRLIDFEKRSTANSQRIEELRERLDPKKQEDTRVGLSGAILLVGCVLACAGFGCWWHRLQKHQDRLLVLQVAAAEKGQYQT